MPYPFALPTTSSISLAEHFTSATHPSLPIAATTRRTVVKDVLKKYKRLAAHARPAYLPTVRDALTDYLPYLLALGAASGYRNVAGDRVNVEVVRPVEVEWRATLSATMPGREPPRPKVVGLHNEIAFVLSTLAYVHSLFARAHLKTLYVSSTVTTEQRTAAIGAAMKEFLEAHAIHAYLQNVPSTAAARDTPPDVQPSTISALASLALAEATLVVVSKDDPYAAAVADDRNENVTDWMFRAPSIPKVRARLYANICLAAADHAGQASALLARSGTGKIADSLVKYAGDLRRTARARAVRFLGIDAELAGETGKALAWLKGARRELGLSGPGGDDERRGGLRGLRHGWQERREDKKIERGGEWGLDAGRFEESRVLKMLETKWDKENSTVNVQAVPDFAPLLATLPSGREYHTPTPYQPPTLDVDTLAQMRAPPDAGSFEFRGDEDDSGGEDMYGRSEPPGAFPGPSATPSAGVRDSSYY